jgi:thioredoxin reductase
VFGTEKRGMDIPILSPTFETNVSGMFIAGELGGMGLIRNAIEQGIQAVNGINKVTAAKHSEQYDLVIVGAGPAGIASALAAKKQGLKFLILEQDSLGGTVAHYPRRKMIMTAPVD